MFDTEKQAEIKRRTEELHSQGLDWVAFYRETLGLHGLVRHLCPTREHLTAFEQTDAYEDLLRMLTKLREQSPADSAEQEPTRVITVRMPKSLHESLRVEAHEHRTSMNKLCISKLVQIIDGERVPAE